MKYYIINHGCQMNEHDSERIAAILEEMGYQPAQSVEEADFLEMNTCLVREKAEDKVFGQLGALKKWREGDPDRILAVSGCMMQTGPARQRMLHSYPQVDLIFGTHNIEKLPALIRQYRESGETVVDIGEYSNETQVGYRSPDPSFAYVNIMTGCDNFCTYCVVPYARGRERSRRPGDILEEVEALADRGCKEVMLLGQNVNSYGRAAADGEGMVSFPRLLERVAQVQGIERVRFMSSHPKDLSDDLIQVMAAYPNIERHFHLPLQAGSDKVLKEMNRRYDSGHYLSLVHKLREAMPDIALSTDIMVGFPGETERDFRDTLDLCRQVEYDSAFTFIYSPRPGTPAAKREDQIPPETASRRFQELTNLLYPIFLKKNRREIGKRVVVRPEGVSKTDASMLSGRDAKNHLVHFPGSRDLLGKMVEVEIKEVNSFALFGERV